MTSMLSTLPYFPAARSASSASSTFGSSPTARGSATGHPFVGHGSRAPAEGTNPSASKRTNRPFPARMALPLEFEMHDALVFHPAWFDRWEHLLEAERDRLSRDSNRSTQA